VIRLYGQRLPRWRAAGRTGTDTAPIDTALAGIDLALPANIAWL